MSKRHFDELSSPFRSLCSSLGRALELCPQERDGETVHQTEIRPTNMLWWENFDEKLDKIQERVQVRRRKRRGLQRGNDNGATLTNRSLLVQVRRRAFRGNQRDNVKAIVPYNREPASSFLRTKRCGISFKARSGS